MAVDQREIIEKVAAIIVNGLCRGRNAPNPRTRFNYAFPARPTDGTTGRDGVPIAVLMPVPVGQQIVSSVNNVP